LTGIGWEVLGVEDELVEVLGEVVAACGTTVAIVYGEVG
jgi:hypothetical protein